MRLKIPKIIPNDWKSVEQAVNRLAAYVLSTAASPTFASLTLTSSLTAANFVSTIATGTSPYACTSTTLNTNLNADLWDGYQFADYLDQAVKTTSDVTFGTLNAGAITGTSLTDGTATLDAGALTGLVSLDGDGTINLEDNLDGTGFIGTFDDLIINHGFQRLGDSSTRFVFLVGGYYMVANNLDMVRFFGTGKSPFITFNYGIANIDFLINTDNVGNFFKIDAGLDTLYVGDGGTTDYLSVTATGNLILKGSAILDWSNVPSNPKIYSQATEPDIPNDTMAFWTDTDDSKYYLILDISGTQKKVELT